MSFYFEGLIVWQKSFQLAQKIHLITKNFPSDEKYALTDQIRRASVSTMSNIAEGSGRGTVPDRNHFLNMARGSAMEVASQLMLAREFSYIEDQSLFEECIGLIEEITKITFSLTKS